MSAIAKEGITVKAGQVWKDLDVRVQGPGGGPRICTVVCVTLEYATMSVNGANPYRTSRVRINRMHKGATGWALVSDAAA